ncbi:diguanylate cyclase [Shewanella sp. Scap07]|uniref:diguanylate cyclase n=1 Tax=Shewanella sp. Scap07 TaxID=2589987 RepID=UPI0015BDFB15|nr:diguanylate cyclase [Shewanella sp. Scap07]QLE85728.1 diguanylate cyclase [Shewanella sp. Scap07]
MNIKSQILTQLILAILLVVMISINLFGLKEVQTYSYDKLQNVLEIEQSIANLKGKLWLLQKYQDTAARIQADEARNQLGQLLQALKLERPQEQMLINNIKRLNSTLNSLLRLAETAPSTNNDTSILSATGMLTARLNTTMLSMGEELTQLQQLVIGNAQSTQNKLLYIVGSTLLIIALLVISFNLFTLSRLRAGQRIFTDEFKKMAKGDLDSQVHISHNNEFKTLGQHYNQMKRSLATITQRKEALANEVEAQAKALKSQHLKLQHLAEHDDLTGLLNRRAFESLADKTLSRCRRHHQGLALLFIDIDKFKQINDVYGHGAGDDMLKALARSITAMTRQADICCRLGGDEFIICIEPIKDPNETLVIVEKLFSQIDLYNQQNQHKNALRGQHSAEQNPDKVEQHQLQISVGISCFPHNGDSLPLLVKTADHAMYRAKKAQGNSFYIADSSPNLVSADQTTHLSKKPKRLSS